MGQMRRMACLAERYDKPEMPLYWKKRDDSSDEKNGADEGKGETRHRRLIRRNWRFWKRKMMMVLRREKGRGLLARWKWTGIWLSLLNLRFIEGAICGGRRRVLNFPNTDIVLIPPSVSGV